MNTEILTGVTASILTAISSTPQLIKLIREKDAENISTLMYCVLVAGLAAWVYYGILIEDRIIIFSNSFSFLINVSVLVLSFFYKSGKK